MAFEYLVLYSVFLLNSVVQIFVQFGLNDELMQLRICVIFFNFFFHYGDIVMFTLVTYVLLFSTYVLF